MMLSAKTPKIQCQSHSFNMSSPSHRNAERLIALIADEVGCPSVPRIGKVSVPVKDIDSPFADALLVQLQVTEGLCVVERRSAVGTRVWEVQRHTDAMENGPCFVCDFQCARQALQISLPDDRDESPTSPMRRSPEVNDLKELANE